MFKKIYLFELNSWFNKPAFYIYAILAGGLTTLLMGSAAGAFDGATSTVSSLKYVNSPNGLLQIVLGMSIYLFLLFPNVMGAAIHKDFKHNVHKVMYSFPFEKPAYFWGKFLSALTVCAILTLFVCLGAYFGTLLPNVNKDLIGPHSIVPYVHIFFGYLIPSLLLFGSIIFAVVTFSRSVVAGFVVMIAIYILSEVAGAALQNNEWDKIASMVDPFGVSANLFYTKYWTISEENSSYIPFTGLVIWNRILWITIGLSILMWSYFSFDFKVSPRSWKLFNKSREEITSITHRVVATQRINVPEINRSFGFMQNLRSAWHLSKIDLRYILTGGPFIVITILGLLFVLLMFLVSGLLFETATLPTTKEMVSRAGQMFYIFILLLTLVYTGMTINRRTTDNIYQLEDVTPTKDWSFILSKFLSISLMQAVLLLVPIVAGIIYQIYNGYYHFELDVYFRDQYTVKWLQMMPWTLMAILIYTLIPNFYVGLVTVLVIAIGIGFLDRIGIEQRLYKFNQGQGVGYSDMAGYGWYLKAFYFYRVYWILGGLFAAVIGWFVWRRGSDMALLSRFRSVSKKLNWRSASTSFAILGTFLSMGYCIYYHANVLNEFVSSKAQETRSAEYEKTYKRYESMAQPRIIDVNLDVELYPKSGDLDAKGYYFLVNKSQEPVDTLLVMYLEIEPELSFNKEVNLEEHDSVHQIMIYSLGQTLFPDDTLKMNFTVQNEENTIFNRKAPVRENGTFFNSSLFPYIGYQSSLELSDKSPREKNGLKDKERMAAPTDMKARQNTYLSNCSDWIDFEIKIGTEKDQIGMAPGNLIREWEEGGRRYFHYKMKRPMLNFYNVCSAKYEVFKDKWKDVDLAIYYHKGHDFNLDRMMAGMKDGLEYFTSHFSPYQHDQLRILEVPRVGFAQSFANTVPFSENVGFIAMPDDSEEGGVDFTYAITAHEVAHQWWAHQVIGANVQGATMLSESLSEYSSLKVLEKRYGKGKMRKFLKDALDQYLQFRSMEKKKELPLAYNEGQQYIHYKKGSLAFYALSDYLGEDILNGVLSAYIDSVAYQEAPYTTSLELLGMIKAATPDSLQYFIEDMFENITLYDNRIQATDYVKNADGTYTVDITAHVTKYRTNERGRQVFYNQDSISIFLDIEGKKKPMQSYPLHDYIDVGIFGSEKDDEGITIEKELYLKKHKVTEIENNYSIIVDDMPVEVGIDPYNKLIDRNSEDNRRKVKEKE